MSVRKVIVKVAKSWRIRVLLRIWRSVTNRKINPCMWTGHYLTKIYLRIRARTSYFEWYLVLILHAVSNIGTEPLPIIRYRLRNCFCIYLRISMDGIRMITLDLEKWNSMPRFNIKTLSYKYIDSHYKDETVVKPSFHYKGDSYTGKTIYLYWNRT